MELWANSKVKGKFRWKFQIIHIGLFWNIKPLAKILIYFSHFYQRILKTTNLSIFSLRIRLFFRIWNRKVRFCVRYMLIVIESSIHPSLVNPEISQWHLVLQLLTLFPPSCSPKILCLCVPHLVDANAAQQNYYI